MNEIETLTCCGQELKHNSSSLGENEGYQVIFYTCEKCGKYIKMYPNQEQAEKLEEIEKENALNDFLIKQIQQRGYHVIKKKDDKDEHGEILLKELRDELPDTEMSILGETKGDQAVVYLQPDCCGDFKLPLISVPADTKNIKYFDYLRVG